jgi:hypothetical protein
MDDSDYAPVGLLLTREKYDDLIDNRSLRSKLDDSLLGTIFNFTAGHVGAIVDFINVIQACDVGIYLFCTSKYSLPTRFTVDFSQSLNYY